MEGYGGYAGVELGQANRAIEAMPKRAIQVDKVPDPTIGENINFKIAALKAEIARLEASKVTLAPLLSMHIRDIRDAMNY